MKRALFAMLLLALPLTAAVSGDPSPAANEAVGEQRLHSLPSHLTRHSDGALLISVCYLSAPPCNRPSQCPSCPEYPAVGSVSLSQWCSRLAGLPVPPVTAAGQPAVGPTCESMGVYTP